MLNTLSSAYQTDRIKLSTHRSKILRQTVWRNQKPHSRPHHCYQNTNYKMKVVTFLQTCCAALVPVQEVMVPQLVEKAILGASLGYWSSYLWLSQNSLFLLFKSLGFLFFSLLSGLFNLSPLFLSLCSQTSFLCFLSRADKHNNYDHLPPKIARLLLGIS